MMTGNDTSLADIAAVTGNGGLFGGNGGDGSFALLILFLFAIMGGNWGNGNGFGGNGLSNEVQRGFDQQALMSGVQNLQNSFASAELSRANNASTLLQAVNNCCCENRQAISDLKYTVATENCADRQTISDSSRDIQTAIANGIQTVLTQMCNDKIDAKNERIAELQTQLNMATLRESQNSQTAAILANNAAQTQALEQYLNPTPIPAYSVPNPNCCSNNFSNCGCGSF